MARYIDVDKLYKSEIERCHCVPLVGSCTNDNKSLRDVLDNAPTEDVVPRSEYEEIKAKLEKQDLWERLLKAESHAPIIAKAKQEVAKEIFEEIDRCMLDGEIAGKYPAKVMHPDKYAELKKKYIGE